MRKLRLFTNGKNEILSNFPEIIQLLDIKDQIENQVCVTLKTISFITIYFISKMTHSKNTSTDHTKGV